MEISVSGQAAALAGAFALGVGVGLAYDLIRIPRAYVRIHLLGTVLDFLFWLAVTAALFLYAINAGNGEVRIFMVAALFGGALFYFLLFSPWIRAFSQMIITAVTAVWHFITFPLIQAANAIKKLKEKLKKSFSSWCKRYKMRQKPAEGETVVQRGRPNGGRRSKWKRQKKQGY